MRPSVLLAAIATLFLVAHAAMGQLPALDLESPILPGGSVVAPTQTQSPVQSAAPTLAPVTVPNNTGHGASVTPAVPIQGQFPVGSAFPGQNMNDPQVAQASFVGCTSCGERWMQRLR